MRIISQYSRLSHHTNTTGLTFSVPTQDTNMQLWDSSNLALSEIGVDELNHQVYIRIGDEIHQFAFGGNLPQNDLDCCNAILDVLGTMSYTQEDIITMLEALSEDLNKCCVEMSDTMTYVIGATLSRVDNGIILIDDKIDSIINGLKPIYITYSVNTTTTNYVVIQTTKYVYTSDPNMGGKTSSTTINFGTQKPYSGWFPTNDGHNWYYKDTNHRRYYSPDPFGGPRMISEESYKELFKIYFDNKRPYDYLGPDYLSGRDFNLTFTKNEVSSEYVGGVITIGSPRPYTKPLYPGYDPRNPKKSLRKFRESTSNYKSGLSKDGKTLL